MPYSKQQKFDKNKPDFYKVIGFVAGVQEEPDFFDKMVYAGLLPGAAHVHHPLVGRLVVFFSLVWRNIPERRRQKEKRAVDGRSLFL